MRNPHGVEGRVPYKGPVSETVFQFNALVFPKTGKTSDEKSPPVLVQNPQDRSGCSSALPYPVLG